MKCPKCNEKLKSVKVKIDKAKQAVKSYQCTKCDFFTFEQASAKKAVKELQETALKIRQKVVKLSQDRLGIYFNKHIVESLGIKKGENIFVSVPDKKHIVIELK